ncbi:hypothetical protein GCM10007276_28690 [Agaricicola taiwanensis]|uniref:Uncharacterized protein n=1 Tax=Agaricicola taiwanensis TaxID=591372 RepID=A0A8J2YL27_9RHOB|nr:hypothetical protein [Agaricicola taiwanensis]GGE49821.1 hypothetical protein GCM10007276_28690 [Agaricicola taiwanensis]
MRLVRFLLRLIGTCLIAGGFVALVIDGTRSIADGRLFLTSFGSVLKGIDPSLEETLREAIQTHVAFWLWDPVMVWVLSQPASAVLAVLGALLIVMGRKPRRHRLETFEYA